MHTLPYPGAINDTPQYPSTAQPLSLALSGKLTSGEAEASLSEAATVVPSDDDHTADHSRRRHSLDRPIRVDDFECVESDEASARLLAQLHDSPHLLPSNLAEEIEV